MPGELRDTRLGAGDVSLADLRIGVVAAGIVLGAKVPAALGSRGDPLSSRVASAALAALRSGMRQG